MARSSLLALGLSLLLACGDDDVGGAVDASLDAPAFDAPGLDAPPAVDTGTDAGPAEPTVMLPRTGIEAAELAVIVNDMDPQSVALAERYVSMRGIPAENVVTLSFAPSGAVMDLDTFGPLKDQVDAALGPDVQAMVLTWTQPYRVTCMSITSAFALGFDDMYCNTTGMACGATANIDYFDSASTRPFTDHGLRPAMMLAATSVDEGEALIARGVAADDTLPPDQGWLVRTTDMARSVRHPQFARVVEDFDHEGGIRITAVDNSDGSGSNVITDQTDVLFYFTGLTRVADLETNVYRPGAIADHLTSFGGRVPDAGGQMSIVEWLRGGATGSYGTTVEPCNFTTKFPNVGVVIPRYFRGNTLIEAYWKSVRAPGEGLFVGEPLARPFGLQTVALEDDAIVIETNVFGDGEGWVFESAESEAGPFTEVATGAAVGWSRQTLRLPRPDAPFVRLRRAE